MKKILFLLLISVTVFSCRVTFTPTKSPEQIAALVDVQTSSDLVYESIIQGEKGFEAHAIDYASLKSKVDGIVSLNKDRAKGKNIYDQSLLLQKYLYKYVDEHKAKGVISASEARVYKSYIKSLIKPILVSELSLKN